MAACAVVQPAFALTLYLLWRAVLDTCLTLPGRALTDAQLRMAEAHGIDVESLEQDQEQGGEEDEEEVRAPGD